MSTPSQRSTRYLLVGLIALLLVAGTLWLLRPHDRSDATEIAAVSTSPSVPSATEPSILADLDSDHPPGRTQAASHPAAANALPSLPSETATTVGTVRIHVLWADTQEAVKNAMISLRPWRYGGASRSGRLQQATNPEGFVAFTGLRPGKYSAVFHAGRAGNRANLTIVAGKTVELEMALPRGISIQGTVLDAAGARVPDAEVLWTDLYGEPEPVALTDDLGEFHVQAILEDGTFFARRAPSAPSTLHRCIVSKGSQSEIVLRLRGPGASLAGTVVNAEGAAIEGVRVGIAAKAEWTDAPHPSETPEYNRPVHLRTTTNSDGSFALEGIAPVLWTLVLDHPDYMPLSQEIGLLPGAAQSVALTLEEGGVIFGSARDQEGESVADALVYVWSNSPSGLMYDRAARTDTSGAFELRGLERLADITVHASGGNPRAEVEASFDLDRVERVEWNPILKPASGLSGLVVTESGEPLTGVHVTITSNSGFGDVAMTRSDGTFVMGENPEGPLNLAVSRAPKDGRPQHPRPLYLETGVIPSGTSIMIRVPDHKLELGALRGRVLDNAGAVPPGVEIIVEAWTFPVALHHSLDATGTFQIEELSVGHFDLRIKSPDRAAWRGSVEIEAGRVAELGEIRLGEGGRLQWEAASLATSTWPDATEVSVRNHAGSFPARFSLQPGQSLGPLAAGEYTLFLSAPDRALAQVRQVHIFDGETTTVSVPTCVAQQSPAIELVGAGTTASLARVVTQGGELVLPTFFVFGEDPIRVPLPGLTDGDYVLTIDSIGLGNITHPFTVRGGSSGPLQTLTLP